MLVLSAATARSNQYLYGWVASPGLDGYNYMVLDSDSSASGSLSDVVSITLDMPNSGETTFTPGSSLISSLTSQGTFGWSPSEIASMDIKLTTTPQLRGSDIYWSTAILGGQNLQIAEDNDNGALFINDQSSAWVAFDSVADYEAACAPLSASVPDSEGTVPLLLIALAFLLAFGWALSGGALPGTAFFPFLRAKGSTSLPPTQTAGSRANPPSGSLG